MDGTAFQVVVPLEPKQILAYMLLFQNVQLIVLVLIAVVILVGFVLEKTLSEHGRVSRGLCKVNDAGELEEIIERTHIYKKEIGAYYEEDEVRVELTGKESVSMNLMGFTSKVFPLMEQQFVEFLKNQGKELKSEYFIPAVLDNVRKQGVKVPVLSSNEQWFGVTYKEDKPIARQNLLKLVEAGVYPEKLWD